MANLCACYERSYLMVNLHACLLACLLACCFLAGFIMAGSFVAWRALAGCSLSSHPPAWLLNGKHA